MKVITEERLIELRDGGSSPEFRRTLKWLVHNECQEIDTLTVSDPNLILEAEKYAEKYSAADGDYIKTDVLNAFYHGAEWQRKQINNRAGRIPVIKQGD